MTRVIVDPELLGKLMNLAQPLQFCSESGNVLGTFTPSPDREAALRAEPFVSEDELQRRAQGEGYTTDEVIAHLESL
jgi:hypothetical protein